MMPTNFFLNPILDDKSLEEIYNVGDYSPLDYLYENYDVDDIKANETVSFSTENILEEDNFTSQMLERNDTFDTTTIYSMDDNFTKTFFTELNEETSDTSLSSTNFNETTIYDVIENEGKTSSKDPVDTSTILDPSSSSTTAETIDDYSKITTVLTSTESPIVTTVFTNEFSEETTDKMSTLDSSSTSLNERVIPLEKKEYVVKCFEQVCTKTMQNTSMNKVRYFRSNIIYLGAKKNASGWNATVKI